MTDPIRVEDYLRLDTEALEALPYKERIEVLDELSQAAGRWLKSERTDVVDNIVNYHGGDRSTAAEALGVEVAWLNGMGDGNYNKLGIRVSDFEYVMDVLSEHSSGTYETALRQAQAALSTTIRHGDRTEWRGVAARIALATRGLTRQGKDALTPAERRRYQRAVAHIMDVSEWKQWKPSLT